MHRDIVYRDTPFLYHEDVFVMINYVNRWEYLYKLNYE